MFIAAIRTFLRKKRYRYLTYATLGVLVLGVIAFRFLEGWRWLDCVNYAVSIMVTTGNSEIYPKSDWGKVFNIFYMLLSVFLILFFIATLQQHFHELKNSKEVKQKRHQKIINKKLNHQKSDD